MNSWGHIDWGCDSGSTASSSVTLDKLYTCSSLALPYIKKNHIACFEDCFKTRNKVWKPLTEYLTYSGQWTIAIANNNNGDF